MNNLVINIRVDFVFAGGHRLIDFLNEIGFLTKQEVLRLMDYPVAIVHLGIGINENGEDHCLKVLTVTFTMSV